MPSPSLENAAQFVQKKLGIGPGSVGIVLGSGLGALTGELEDPASVKYGAVPRMPTSSVPGHEGQIWRGRLGTAEVVCLQGRCHLYEGRPVADVVFGVGLLARLGCRAVLLSNAAGSLRQDLPPGRLMLITDHINLCGESPLQGPEGFVDMSHAYDAGLQRLARSAAETASLELDAGVYAGVRGPNYETPAEIRMLATLGADAVGMSTVCEVIALRALGVPVGAVSCITNFAAGIGQSELSHEEVEETAGRASPHFHELFRRWAVAISREKVAS